MFLQQSDPFWAMQVFWRKIEFRLVFNVNMNIKGQ